MNNFILGLAVLGMTAFPMAAMADHHGDDGEKKGHKLEKMFEKHDIDGDGEISKAEFLKQAEERFVKMDTNGDGVITKAEAKERAEKMREKWKERKNQKDDTPSAE